jgi:CRP-like cAMP-binding protein
MHMGFTTSLPHTNRLLDSLPRGDRERFLADCETVEMGFGQILFEPGDSISHVYFPLESFISLIASLESGGRLEVSMAGNEGMLGTSLILGVHESPLLALIQGAGPALRMSSAGFQDHLGQSPALERVMKRYLNVLLNQISQSAACAHYHGVEARLARWLLMTHDRTHADQLHLTHEFLSSMLGVRRAGVTLAAKALQSRGLIDYQRGRVTVRDRPGLEEASCRCYATDREIYDQMLGEGA